MAVERCREGRSLRRRLGALIVLADHSMLRRRQSLQLALCAAEDIHSLQVLLAEDTRCKKRRWKRRPAENSRV